MASHVRTSGALVDLVIEGATGAIIRLIPHNREAKDLLDTFFTAHGSKTTVALAQEDAGRDGAGLTGDAYQAIKATFS